MRNASYSVQFKRDLKLSKKRGKNLKILEEVIETLVDGDRLPARYKDHALSNNWKHHRECHLEPDWLLIYKIFDDDKSVRFERLGTHSDLFE